MTPKLQSLIKPIGLLLVAISLVFLGQQLWSLRAQLADWSPRPGFLLVLIGLIVGYWLACLLLTLGFNTLIVWLGRRQIGLLNTHSVYGKTQLARYLPGNVLHFAGRYAWGRQQGYSHAVLASATLFEIVGMLGMASAFAALGVLFTGLEHGLLSPGYLVIGLCGPLAVILGFGWIAPRLARRKGLDLPVAGIRDTLRGLALPLLAYGGYVLALSALFGWLALTEAAELDWSQVPALIFGFSIAWLAGFVVPGSPGGIGVREAVLAVALGPIVGSAEIIVLGLVFRVVSTLGDALNFLSAVVAGRMASSKTPHAR